MPQHTSAFQEDPLLSTDNLDLLSVEVGEDDNTLHLPPVLTHDVAVDMLDFFMVCQVLRVQPKTQCGLNGRS